LRVRRQVIAAAAAAADDDDDDGLDVLYSVLNDIIVGCLYTENGTPAGGATTQPDTEMMCAGRRTIMSG